MILSMTGFGAASRTLGLHDVHLELRGVNSRYLDLSFRLSDELRHCEPLLRGLFSARLSRGKVECRLSLRTHESALESQIINEPQLARLALLSQKIQADFPLSAPLSVADVLRWPGLIQTPLPDESQIPDLVMALGQDALEQFIDSRRREGEKLVGMLMERVEGMRALVQAVTPRVPVLVAEYHDKLTSRLREAVACLDEDRIRQEVALFAQRMDVAEELSRLVTHLDELERILRSKGPSGKRLDFLMQELNREANTLSSKSAAVDATQMAMEMKVLIEQMREQVQNIE
jgi:uncharacterized protein (TIGR00255 family)